MKYLRNGQNKNHGISPSPSTILFDDPHTQTTPPNLISPCIHQKMRKGCRNDYPEAFGTVYWAKKAVLKKSKEQLPLRGRGLYILVHLTVC